MNFVQRDWETFSGRRILITGGTGFLGRSLLDYLVAVRKNGDNTGLVTVLTRSPDAFLNRFPQYRHVNGLAFVAGALDDLASLVGTFTDLLHAADDTHRRDSPLGWFEQIVRGTRQALDCAVRTGVQRFLLVSSGAVYGSAATAARPWSEISDAAPLTTDIATPYGNGKRAAEHLCALYSAEHALECVIARCFAILSPHVPLDGPYAVGNFLHDALSGLHDTIRVNGDGTAVRSYLSGPDMAHWMFTLLRHGAAGEVYNVGGKDPITMRALAELIRDTLAPEKSVMVAANPTSSVHNVYVPDTRKARALGLDEQLPLAALVAQVGATLRTQTNADRAQICDAIAEGGR